MCQQMQLWVVENCCWGPISAAGARHLPLGHSMRGGGRFLIFSKYFCLHLFLTFFYLPLVLNFNCWICQRCYMDFSKLLHGFLKIDTCISLICYMDLSKLLHGFFKVVLCISRLLPNKTKLKFDQDFKAFWSFCFEQKVLNESGYSMPWVCCAFGNDYNYFTLFYNFCVFLLMLVLF